MPRKKRLRIGLAQVPVKMGDKRANLRTLFAYLDRAARAKCDVAAFPECSLAGWMSPAAKAAAETIPGPLTAAIGEEARRRRMAVVVGLEEREGSRIYNTAVFIDRDGRVAARHRKVNELEMGLAVYSRGESLGVFQFEGRAVALHICADSWVPEVTDALYLMGARMIFSPSAWAIQPGGESCNIHWIRDTYAARTRGKDLIVVSPNGVGKVTQGPWRGRILQGNSLVTGPDGRHVLQGPANRPALLTLEV
jgi:predicted amidohydrolase